MSEPLVGIIVPCYNQGHFAEQCISSVRQQTYRNWRAIVVDDASTDGSGAQLDRLAGGSVEVIHVARNVGLPGARNVALRELKDAEFILPVDCDDYLSPEFIERVMSGIHRDERIALSYGTLKFFGMPHPMGLTSWPPSEFVFERRYLGNIVPCQSLMRASVIRGVGGWNDEFNKSGQADYDLWLRVVEQGWRVTWVREATYFYRLHPDSMWTTTDERKRVAAHRNLFRFHAREIASSIGVEGFLSQRLLPAFYTDVHDGRWRPAAKLFATLIRHAPLETLRIIGKHYGARLLSRVR